MRVNILPCCPLGSSSTGHSGLNPGILFSTSRYLGGRDSPSGRTWGRQNLQAHWGIPHWSAASAPLRDPEPRRLGFFFSSPVSGPDDSARSAGRNRARPGAQTQQSAQQGHATEPTQRRNRQSGAAERPRGRRSGTRTTRKAPRTTRRERRSKGDRASTRTDSAGGARQCHRRPRAPKHRLNERARSEGQPTKPRPRRTATAQPGPRRRTTGHEGEARGREDGLEHGPDDKRSKEGRTQDT